GEAAQRVHRVVGEEVELEGDRVRAEVGRVLGTDALDLEGEGAARRGAERGREHVAELTEVTLGAASPTVGREQLGRLARTRMAVRDEPEVVQLEVVSPFLHDERHAAELRPRRRLQLELVEELARLVRAAAGGSLEERLRLAIEP